MVLGDDGNVDIRFVGEFPKVLVRIQTKADCRTANDLNVERIDLNQARELSLPSLYSSQLSLKTKGMRSIR